MSAANPDDVYYMVTFSSGIEYWKGCYNGFESAAAKYGAKTEYTGANTNDVNQEVTVLEQVIAKNPAGIAVTCVNPEGLKDPIQKAIDQGIPVVTFDSDSPDSGRYSFLATGNYAAGVEAATAIAELCGEQGEVGILQVPGLLNLEERANGFKAVSYTHLVRAAALDLEARKLLTGQEREAVLAHTEWMEGFLKTSLYERIKTAGRVLKEQPFNLEVKAQSIGYEGEGSMMVQGILDLAFLEDKWVLVDYKTDRVTHNTVEQAYLLYTSFCKPRL